MIKMQDQVKKEKSPPRMKWQNMLLFLTGFVLLVWLSTIATAPLQKNRKLQQEVENDSLFTASFKSIYDHPDMQQLVKEKTFREALLKLSEDDSIQLVINLHDSTVGLSIKGVNIHQVRIHECKKDIFLEKIPLIQEVFLLSGPLRTTAHYATIVKQPVIVRHAPKDTLEAGLNAWQPDTLIQHPAFVAYSGEHDFRIIFEQEHNRSFDDHWTRCMFYAHLGSRKIIASLKDFLSFRKQEYLPTLTIKMPVNDLRAIYRALPHNTSVVLKL